jgi:hypothetical protein
MLLLLLKCNKDGNAALNIQPNGASLVQGQGFLVIQEGDNGIEEENTTNSFVELSPSRP